MATTIISANLRLFGVPRVSIPLSLASKRSRLLSLINTPQQSSRIYSYQQRMFSSPPPHNPGTYTTPITNSTRKSSAARQLESFLAKSDTNPLKRRDAYIDDKVAKEKSSGIDLESLGITETSPSLNGNMTTNVSKHTLARLVFVFEMWTLTFLLGSVGYVGYNLYKYRNEPIIQVFDRVWSQVKAIITRDKPNMRSWSTATTSTTTATTDNTDLLSESQHEQDQSDKIRHDQISEAYNDDLLKQIQSSLNGDEPTQQQNATQRRQTRQRHFQ